MDGRSRRTPASGNNSSVRAKSDGPCRGQGSFDSQLLRKRGARSLRMTAALEDCVQRQGAPRRAFILGSELGRTNAKAVFVVDVPDVFAVIRTGQHPGLRVRGLD